MIDTLTGMRAFAALWVFFNHYFFNYPYPQHFPMPADLTIAKHLFKNGWIGVEIFFVLSGYVISHVYQNKFVNGPDFNNTRDFLLLRFGRLWPINVLAVIAITIFFIAGIGDWSKYDINTECGLLSFSLLQATKICYFNTPSWSASAEFFAYFTFPFVIRYIVRYRNNFYNQLAIIFFMMLCNSAFGSIQNVMILNAPFRAISSFIIGAILYNMQQHNFIQKTRWDIVFLGAISGLFAVTFTVDNIRESEFYALAYFFIIILVFSTANGGFFVKNLLANRVMIYLGEISYSLYMLHTIVIVVMQYYLQDYYAKIMASGNNFVIVANVLGTTAILILISALCFHLVENPCRNFVKKLVKR